MIAAFVSFENKFLVVYFSLGIEILWNVVWYVCLLICKRYVCSFIGAGKLGKIPENHNKFPSNKELFYSSQRVSILMWKNLILILKVFSILPKERACLEKCPI